MKTNNYFEYCNRFWQAGEIEPFTPSATALYFYLLYEANRRFWKMPIICGTSFLAFRLSLSKQGIYDARNLLAERGFLKYVAGDRFGAAAKYTVTFPSIDEVSSDRSSNQPSEESTDVTSNPSIKASTKTSSDQPSNQPSNQSSDQSSNQSSVYLSNNNNINSKSKQNSSPYSNAREEIALKALKEILSNDTAWLRDIAETLSCPKIRSPTDVGVYLNTFFDEQRAQGTKAREESECRKHFFFWLKKKIIKTKPNEFRTNIPLQRRGSGVSNGTAADFEQPFRPPVH